MIPNRKHTKRSISQTVLATACVSLLCGPAFAAGITVTNTNDSGPGSLRQAIASAQAGDVIRFNVSGTIVLNSTLTIDTTLTITGPGAQFLALDGNNATQILVVNSGAVVKISGLTVQNANTTGYNNGGAILNYGTLTLNNIVATSNVGSQGAILNLTPGALTLMNSTLSGNVASYGGGGVEGAGTQLTIIGSTISGNSAGQFGGGVFTGDGPTTIINSTLANNTSGYKGGGLYTGGATTTVINSTIAGNSAPWGGGIYTFALTLKNSIVANNQASSQGANCILEAPITSAGHNLVDDNTCALSGVGDMNNIAAGLDPGGLKDNGGTTQTIALAINSPALNAVPVAPANDCTLADNVTPIVTDARGVFRPEGAACDIGAFEAFAGDDDSAYAQLGGSNTFTGNQTVNGAVSATTFVGDGSALTGVSKITSVTPGSGLVGGGSAGAIALAVDTTVARTNAGNTFTGNQTVNGSLNASGDLTSGGSLTIGGGTPILRHISATLNIGFSPLKAGACAVLGSFVNGVSAGDTVVVTPSNSLMQASGIPLYTGWVGAAPNIVQLRACNLDPSTPQKTTVSGTIRIDVWKH